MIMKSLLPRSKALYTIILSGCIIHGGIMIPSKQVTGWETARSSLGGTRSQGNGIGCAWSVSTHEDAGLGEH